MDLFKGQSWPLLAFIGLNLALLCKANNDFERRPYNFTDDEFRNVDSDIDFEACWEQCFQVTILVINIVKGLVSLVKNLY